MSELNHKEIYEQAVRELAIESPELKLSPVELMKTHLKKFNTVEDKHFVKMYIDFQDRMYGKPKQVVEKHTLVTLSSLLSGNLKFNNKDKVKVEKGVLKHINMELPPPLKIKKNKKK